MHMGVSHISSLLALLTAGVMAFAQGANPEKTGATVQASANAGVKYFSKDDVAASFAKGGTLVTESNYRVMTAHRTESGNVESGKKQSAHNAVMAIALHDTPAADVALEKLIQPSQPERLREQAIFWLGVQRGAKGV